MNKLLLRSLALFILLGSSVFAQLQPVQNIPLNGTTYVYGSSTYLAWYFNGYEAGLTVELQVSTNSDVSSPFVDVTGLTGLTYQVSGLSEGTTYYWRIRSKSSGGAYSAWTGIWSFTVSGYGGGGTTTPLVPQLNIPLNGSTITSTSTSLAWYLNGSGVGLTYHVQVSTSGSFGTFFANDSGLTSLTYGLSGLSDGSTYYWRVRSKNSGGTKSAWSTTFSFAVDTGGGGVTTPLVPQLNIPLNGSTLDTTSTSLVWYLNGSSFGLTYHVQVSTSGSFGTFFANDSGLTSFTYALSGLADGSTYYWRVRSKNSVGTKSAWSTIFSFDVDLGIPVTVSPPIHFSPADGTTGFSYHPTLYWYSVIGAISYDLRVSGDSTFTIVERSYTGLTDTSKHIHYPKATEYLELDSTYYWQVRVTTALGTSDWSSPWDFTTKDTPDTPTQLSPADGYTAAYTSVELVWSNVIKADTYDVEIYADTNAAVFDTYSGADTSYFFNGDPSTQYWWKVSATGNSNTSAFSGYWSFTTGATTIWYVETTGNDSNTGTSPLDPLLTIQAAIDSADPGDKISVGAGTFEEDLVITTNNLEIFGTGYSSTTRIKGIKDTTSSVYITAFPNIDIRADSIKIHDFIIESPNVGDDRYSSGIVFYGKGIEFYNNNFHSVTTSSDAFAEGDGYAIVMQSWNYTLGGPFATADISGLKVYNNIFTWADSVNAGGVGGYEGVWLNPSYDSSSTIEITGNTFSDNCRRAIAVQTSNSLVDNNTMATDLLDNRGIWILRGEEHTVSNNEIEGFAKGIGLGAPWAGPLGDNVVVSNNDIHDNYIGIEVDDDFTVSTPTIPPVINNNTIYDNTYGLIAVTAVGDPSYFVLNAKDNYWGSVDGPGDIHWFDTDIHTGTKNELPAGSAALVKTWVNEIAEVSGTLGNSVVDNDNNATPGTGNFYIEYYPWLGGIPSLDIEDESTSTGATVSLDVTTNLFSSSFNYTLTGRFVYDDSKLDFLIGSVGASTLLNGAGWTAVFYESSSGVVDFVAYGFSPIIGSGTLFTLSFDVIAGAAGSTTVTGSYSDYLAGGSALFGTSGSFSGTVSYTYTATPSTLQGDADLDSDVDYDDVLLMAQHVAGDITLTGQAFTNADVDGDLDVDVNDISATVDYIINGSWSVSPSPISLPNLMSFNHAVENTDNGMIDLPFSVNALGQEVQSVEFILVYDESELDYQAFAGALEGNANFVHASKISDGIAKFVFASSEGQTSTFELGSMKFKKGVVDLKSTVTSIYKINGGSPQVGPSYDLNGVTGVEDEELPSSYEVSQNYPNPFNPSTTIKYSVPNATFVTIKVYNMLGQEVKTLISREVAAGRFTVNWNGDNNYGSKVSSGTYIYQIIAGDFVQAKKMILLK